MKSAAWLLASFVATIAVPAAAQNTAAPTGAPLPPPPAPEPFATMGAFDLTGVANVDLIDNATGGERKALKGLGKFALAAAYDGSRDGHDGLTGLASLQYTTGGRPSAHAVGDAQGVDNIEAVGALRIYEIWLAKDYDGAKGWKAGLIDLNVDYDTQTVASLFINSSDGAGAELGHSGLNGPSIFPTTGLGVTGFVRVGANITLRLGLFDGTAGSPYHPSAFAVRLSGSDGVLLIGQAEQRFDGGLRLVGGVWGYSARFDAVDRFQFDGSPLRYRRSRGMYGLVEAPLIKVGSDGERGLSGWIRAGIADPLVLRISGYTGGGLVYTGPLQSRPQDQVGIAINHAVLEPDQDVARKTSETAFELTYRYNGTDWLAVQPDAQVVLHPSGIYRTALVVGIRLSFTLTKNIAAKLKEVAH